MRTADVLRRFCPTDGAHPKPSNSTHATTKGGREARRSAGILNHSQSGVGLPRDAPDSTSAASSSADIDHLRREWSSGIAQAMPHGR